MKEVFRIAEGRDKAEQMMMGKKVKEIYDVLMVFPLLTSYFLLLTSYFLLLSNPVRQCSDHAHPGSLSKRN